MELEKCKEAAKLAKKLKDLEYLIDELKRTTPGYIMKIVRTNTLSGQMCYQYAIDKPLARIFLESAMKHKDAVIKDIEAL